MCAKSEPPDLEELAPILAEYLTRIDRGEPVGREELLAEYPEHFESLRNYFADVDLIEGLATGGSSASPVAAAATPLEFGEYDLLCEIGRGGMGIVYQARERCTDRLVALKLLLHGVFTSSSVVRRFQNEARAAAALNHPGIVPIYRVGEYHGHLFYTMPLIHGSNLAERLTNGPLEPCLATKLLLAVADAVDFAHSHGVVHRDLKPANILLDEHDRPHVADFGLARRLGDEPLGITATGDLLGTPNYMAPEQVNGSPENVGASADVYALGAVLYALLVGQPPFQSNSVSETLHRICSADPVRPRQIRRSVPRDLETICLKCLEKSPVDRYGSAREVADELRRFIAGEPLLAQPVSQMERGRRWFVRNPVIATLTIGIAIALIAGTGFSIHYARQARQRERQSLAYLYAADMNLAQQHVRSGAIASALRLLERHRQKSGAIDSQGWEWRHLWQQCHAELRRFEGPRGAVSAVEFGPDGRNVAAAGTDLIVWIWETATGRLKFSLKGHSATIRDLAFAPDGQKLVTVGDDGACLIWDTATGERLVTLSGHERPVTSVACSADGRFIATGGNSEAEVIIWDAATRALNQSLDVGPVHSLAFAPGTARLGIAGLDGCVRVCELGDSGLWSVGTTIRAHEDIVRDLAWSPDGTRLATAAADCAVKLWDTTSWREIATIGPFKEAVYSIRFRPDGKRLAMAARNEPLKIWDLDQRQIVAELHGHTALVTCVDYCLDGWRLVSCSEDGTIRMWDAAGQTDHDRLEAHFPKIRTVAFSPDGTVLASGTADDTSITLWNSFTGQPLDVFRTRPAGIVDLAFRPDGKYLAAAEGRGHLRIWNVETGDEAIDLTINSGPVVGVAWSPDGDRIAVQTSDGHIRLLDASTGRELARCASPKGHMGSISFGNNGRFIVTAIGDKSIRIWQSDTLSLVRELKGHTGPVVNAVFNPQGTLIASSSNDHTIRLWEAETGRHLRTLTGHGGTTTSIVFNPNGTRLASSSTDQTVKLWDVATGLELQSLARHADWVRDVAFSPDGQHIASGGYDGTVRMWRALGKSANWSVTREAAALVKFLAARYPARQSLLEAIGSDQTISGAVRTSAIDLTNDILLYWPHLIAGYQAATRRDWTEATEAFDRVTKLAPDDAMHWHWLAITSVAAGRDGIYQRACDEMLRRYGASANVSEWSLTAVTCLTLARNGHDLASLGPLVSAWPHSVSHERYIPWLYQLRLGEIPGEFLDSKGPFISSDAPATEWLVQAMAWHKAGNEAKAQSAYDAAVRRARSLTANWQRDVIYESLRREVEEMLAVGVAREE